MSIDTSVILALIGISALLIACFYVPDIRFGLNMGDEGYLWYGVKKVLEKKIPIRDFRAYDPGRYYWMLPWYLLFGKNIVSLRIAQVFTQFITVFICLLFIYTMKQTVLLSALFCLCIVPWLIPRHKQIDFLFSILTPLIIFLVIQIPSFSSLFLLGIYFGVCLFFGLNHAIYAFISLILLFSLMSVKGTIGLAEMNFIALFSGFFLLLLPVFFALAFVPRLFSKYWQEKIVRIITRGQANLRLPLPWLWNKNTPQLNGLSSLNKGFIKLVFSAMPLLYSGVVVQFFISEDLTRSLLTNLVLACSGMAYFHHASSRADISHIAQSSLPFTLILINLLGSYWLFFLLIGYVYFSFFSIYWPSIEWLKYWRNSKHYKKLKMKSASIIIPAQQEIHINKIKNLVTKYSSVNDFVVLLPNIVSFYPLLEREPAIYNVFSVYAATKREQQEMIEQLSLNQPSFILINNNAIDARDQLKFSNSHSSVWQYIENNFYEINSKDLPVNYYAFRLVDTQPEVSRKNS